MRARYGILLVGAALTVLLASPAARATDDGGGRSVFARGAGERALGMGGAFGALADDASAMFWNPAGLARTGRVNVQASHTDLIGLGFYEQYGSVVLPSWRLGNFGIALRRFGVDGIEGRDDRGALTEENLEDAESELSFGYARQFGTAWALGLALKWQNQELAGASGNGLGMDLGVLVRPLLAAGGTSTVARGLSLGLTVRNAVEPSLQLLDEVVPDPPSVRIGTALELPLGSATDLRFAADLERTRAMDSRLHAGAELVLLDLLALRAGTNDGMLAAGAGVTWRGLTVAYAFEDNILESVHRFGLGVAFGPTAAEHRQAALDREQQELDDHLVEAFRRESENRNRTLVAEANAALQRGDYTSSLQQAQALLVLAPDHTEGKRLAARSYVGQAQDAEAEGHLTTAAVAYERCLTLDPGQTTARVALDSLKTESDRQAQRSAAIRALDDEGMAHYVAGRYAEAREVFLQVLEMDPADREATSLLHLVDQSILSEERVGVATSRTRATPSAGSARLTPAPSGAEPTPAPASVAAPPTFSSLPAARRDEIAGLYRKGVQAAGSGNRDDAVRYWELVWSAAPDYQQVGEYLKQEYLARGMEAFADGRLDLAATIWEQALEIDPDDPRTRGYLDRAHEHQARLREYRGSD